MEGRVKLREIAEIRTGLVLARKKGDVHDAVHRTYRVVSLKAFGENGYLAPDALDTFVAQEALDAEYITHPGDVLVRLRAPNLAAYIDEQSAGLVIPSHVAIIRSGSGALVNEYLAHHLNANRVQNRLSKLSKGTTISMIKTKDLADLEVRLPTLDVQRKTLAWLRLANRETELMEALKAAKNRYKKEILDTIIQQGKKA